MSGSDTTNTTSSTSSSSADTPTTPVDIHNYHATRFPDSDIDSAPRSTPNVISCRWSSPANLFGYCFARFATPEDLLEHVLERHLGDLDTGGSYICYWLDLGPDDACGFVTSEVGEGEEGEIEHEDSGLREMMGHIVGHICEPRMLQSTEHDGEV